MKEERKKKRGRESEVRVVMEVQFSNLHIGTDSIIVFSTAFRYDRGGISLGFKIPICVYPVFCIRGFSIRNVENPKSVCYIYSVSVFFSFFFQKVNPLKAILRVNVLIQKRKICWEVYKQHAEYQLKPVTQITQLRIT